MRSRLLAGAALALLAVPATGQAQSNTGGAGYGHPLPRLVATNFSVSPRTLQAGAAATFGYRIDGPQRSARVRIELLPVGGRRPAARVRLGYKRTGVALTRTWTPPAGKLTPGDYVARLHAVDRSGRTLSRSATASGRSQLVVAAPPPAPAPALPPAAPVGSGIFPVRGPYTFGDGFGVQRGEGHTHRGVDILTAEGTPVVTPRAGVVFWRAYQDGGAGHYVVVRADDGRDFVFMHLKGGSITVTRNATLAAGQVFAQVGSTGRSTGSHLHFEVWPDGWYSSDASQPTDPMPDLRAWAGG